MRDAWIVALIGLAPAALSAQSARVGVRLERYTFDDPALVGISEVEVRSAPVALAVALGPILLDARGGYAQATLVDALGGRVEVSGLGESEVGLGVRLGGLTARLAAGPPTTRELRSFAEARISGATAFELLPFAMPYWAGGGSLGGDLGFSHRTDRLDVSMVGGYRAQGTRRILADREPAFRPGDRITLRAALRTSLGLGTLSIAAMGHRFGEDALDGASVYRPGAQVEAAASYAFPVRAASAIVSAGFVRSAPGAALVREAELAEPGLLAGIAHHPGYTLLHTGAELRFGAGRAGVRTGGEFRILRTSGLECIPTQGGEGDAFCPATEGWLASAGAALDLQIGGPSRGTRVMLSPAAGLRAGRAGHARGRLEIPGAFPPGGREIEPGPTTPIVGWEMGVSLRLEGAP